MRIAAVGRIQRLAWMIVLSLPSTIALRAQAPDPCAPRTVSSRLTYVKSPAAAQQGTVRGQISEFETGRPPGAAVVMLVADSTRRVFSDTTGRFEFNNVPPGRYVVSVRAIGRDEFRDTIVVPLGDRQLALTLVAAQDLSDLMWCSYKSQLASAPALTLVRPETVVVERSMPDGSRLRHTVIVHAERDRLSVNSHIMNISDVHATIENLCYPETMSPALMTFHGIGPTCYSQQGDIAPSATANVTTGGDLRGRPGRYTFVVHAIDPSAINVSFQLDLVFLKPQ